MFPSHASERAAVVRQFLDALDSYERDLDALVTRGWDPLMYSQLGEHFKQMRMYAGSLPEVSVRWAQLLINRFELTQLLWDTGTSPQRAAELERLHEVQKDIIAALRVRCRSLLMRRPQAT